MALGSVEQVVGLAVQRSVGLCAGQAGAASGAEGTPPARLYDGLLDGASKLTSWWQGAWTQLHTSELDMGRR